MLSSEERRGNALFHTWKMTSRPINVSFSNIGSSLRFEASGLVTEFDTDTLRIEGAGVDFALDLKEALYEKVLEGTRELPDEAVKLSLGSGDDVWFVSRPPAELRTVN
jgi:hypothetical protein